jgi:site-specific DNA-methyltransferase (cytosine-N4-specific)
MVKHEHERKLDKIHSYPAKYTIDTIEKYILKYSGENDIVYDPFVGCGTTLLTANINNRIAYGTDINGIAILISQFKISPYTNDDILKLQNFAKTIRDKVMAETKCEKKYYKSINHWFCEIAIDTLSLLLFEIEKAFSKSPKLLLFCKVVFSSILTLSSNQESDTRYASKDKGITKEYIVDTFVKKFNIVLNIVSNCDYSSCVSKSKALQINSKTSSEKFGKNSVDMIITSPPYPNTYDYYLYHKHRMLWLDYSVEKAMQQEIGSRREFSSLKKPAENFSNDIKDVFIDCDKMLKKGKYAIIIIGDGQIGGNKYDSRENIINIAKGINWELVDECYNELDNISRSFQQSFRVKGKKEYVLVFKNGA